MHTSRRLLHPVTAEPPSTAEHRPPLTRYRLLNVVSALLIVLAFVFISCIYLFRRRRRRRSTCSSAVPASLGGPKSELDEIPIVTYGGPTADSESESCAICLGELEIGESVRVLPRCRHVFHVECIDSWLLVRSLHCPVCRDRTIQASPPSQNRNCNETTASVLHNFTSVRNIPSYI